MHISDYKHHMRSSAAERLSRLSELDRERESRSICRRLLEIIPAGSTACAYARLKTEPDLSTLIKELWRRGDGVFFPCFEGDHFTFRKADDFSELKAGKLKILEPHESSAEAIPKEIGFVIIPGRAFDRSGNRLGRGNGGYDSWIANQRKINPKTRMIGVAFECQIVNEVPVDEHDEKMDEVVTARGYTKKY